jgi:hypothetical protein
MSGWQNVVGAGAGEGRLSGPIDPGTCVPGVPEAPRAVSGVLRQSVREAVSFPVLMAVLLVGVSLLSLRFRLPDPDTWWHVAVGERILATHTWPSSDSYSFTATGAHWIAYEWVGEVVMALAARAGGVWGLAALLVGLIAILTVLLYCYVCLRCGSSKAACLATALLLPVAAVSFTLRPQLLGYSFLLLTLICLERFRRGHRRALWFLPFLFLVWVNMHGTFALGLAAIGLYWASGLVSFEQGGLRSERWTEGERLQLLVTFLLCTLALLVTPYGSRLAAYPLEMATLQPVNIANIQEWQPLSFSLGLGKYLLGLLLVVFLAHIVLDLKYRLEEIGMLVFAVYAICVHIRFVPVFAMLFAPVVANIVVRWVPSYDRAKDKYILNLALIALAVAGLAKVLPGRAELNKMVAKDYPVEAVKYLRQHPQPTRMFNDYGYGGYLIWQLGPQQKVFIDGRADLYEYSGVFQDYIKIVNLDREALFLLRKYDIQSCLVNRTDAIATLLATSPDWRQVYSDELSDIFVWKGARDASRKN